MVYIYHLILLDVTESQKFHKVLECIWILDFFSLNIYVSHLTINGSRLPPPSPPFCSKLVSYF